jgi:high frequency lysogenization protein
MINVIMLQKTVSKQSSLMNQLTSKIEQLSQNFSDANTLDDDVAFENLVKECSTIYQQTLSQLPRRIQVKGEPKYLKQESNQIYVRAILLAAIRACFLWRQLNGSRWDFLLRKNKLIEALRYLIANPISAN